MKIESISPHNYSKRTVTTNKTLSTQNLGRENLGELHDFPKSYLKFSPAFGNSIAKQRQIEQELRMQQDKADYLWAKNWNKDDAKKEYDVMAEKDIEIKHAKAFAYLKASTKENIRTEFNNLFKADLLKYKNIMENKDYYEGLLKNDLVTRRLSVSEIMKSTKGTLDKKIAGYEDLKRDMGRKFLKPVKDELFNGGEKEVANCILLCGPTGCGKTVAAEAMANETACYVERIPTSTNVDDFKNIVIDKVREAKKRYEERQERIIDLKNSPRYARMNDEERKAALLKLGSARTVILVDEFDRYFNKLLAEPSTILANRDCMKQTLDGCSEFPKKGNGKASALTFLCTTNYPTRVDDDLGVGKCDRFGILPPSGKDMEDVIKFYLNDANTLIGEYMGEDNPKLKKVDIKNLNLKKFVEKYAPTEEDGAFSNDAIKFMVLDAAESYIDMPKLDFNLHLIRQFKYSKRDITPEKLEKYIQELSHYDLDIKEEKLPDKKTTPRKEYLGALIKQMKEMEDFLGPKEQQKLRNLEEEYKSLT